MISEGQTAVERSSTLRANVNWIIEKAVRDLRDQADRSELALTEQIEMHEQAVRRLEVELNKVDADSQGGFILVHTSHIDSQFF